MRSIPFLHENGLAHIGTAMDSPARTACWLTVIVAWPTTSIVGIWPVRLAYGGRADVGTGQTSGRTAGRTKWKHNAPDEGSAAHGLREHKRIQEALLSQRATRLCLSVVQYPKRKYSTVVSYYQCLRMNSVLFSSAYPSSDTNDVERLLLST